MPAQQQQYLRLIIMIYVRLKVRSRQDVRLQAEPRRGEQVRDRRYLSALCSSSKQVYQYVDGFVAKMNCGIRQP